MQFEKLAFVDIETTGTSLHHDRIVEIAIIRVENFKIVDRFVSLVNPERYIPPSIIEITGINGSQLEKAPTFGEISQQVADILDGTRFIAHNVRFDYSFVKNEFKNIGISFNQKHSCTVKLSRKLFPEHRHHNLDSIIERFGIKCKNRHRAYDDAYVLFEFLKKVRKKFGIESLITAWSEISKQPSLPVHLEAEYSKALPRTPGVYIFYGENQMPLYVGKSVNIRNRVLSHFQNDHSSATEMKIAQQVTAIETIQTTGELGALLKEAELVKELQPLYNRRLRKARSLMILRRSEYEGFQTVHLEMAENIDPDTVENVFGTFKSKRQAEQALMLLADEHKLCRKMLGLEKASRHCFGYALGKCKGSCIGVEAPLLYNLRFEMAFAKMKLARWPFKGPVAIRETAKDNVNAEMFIIDKWCCVGKISYDQYENPVYHQSDMRFDLDSYKIIRGFLNNPKNISKISELEHKELARIQYDS